jgi:hypothetical protein
MNSASHRRQALDSARTALISAARTGNADAVDFALVTYVAGLYATSFSAPTIRPLIETALVAGLTSEHHSADRQLRASAVAGWMARVDRLLQELPPTSTRRADRLREGRGSADARRMHGST